MSSRGEIVPELAATLRQIADRIAAGAATEADVETLRRVARTAAGQDKLFVLKVHGRPGRKPEGAHGVGRRFEMARAVKAHMDEHGCSNEAAREALSGKFNVGPEALKKAWQEMSPLLAMSEDRRNLLLYFKRLEAKGLGKVTRQREK